MMACHFSSAARIFVGLLIFCFLTVRCDPIEPNEPSFFLRLIDVETNISPVPILFLKKKTAVIVEGLGWLVEDEVTRKIDNSFVHKTNQESLLIYSTFVNEHQVANGTIDLSGSWKKNTTGFTSSIDVGVIEVQKSGQNSIRVELYSVLSGNVIESSTTLNVRSCHQWIASIPIILGFGLFLVFNVHIVHSLFTAMFAGSWIIEGSMISGFRAVLDTYILQAATDSAHALILLFIVGISVLMTMVQKSGGTAAVIKSLRRHSSKSRAAQLVIFMMGLFFFFDPYVSIMLVGKVFGSIVKGLPLSSEKVSFLIDTTAAPVASIFPKSTWMSFAGDLIQTQIDKLMESGMNNISGLNGHSLVLSTITYQFYPSLILWLAFLQIIAGREMGPILKAENQARFNFYTIHHDNGGNATLKKRKWNWYIPVVALNVFLWFAFAQVVIDGGNQNPSSLATTWFTSTVATIAITQCIFIIQKRNGKILLLDYFKERRERTRLAYLADTFPSVSGCSSVSIPFNLSSKSEDSDGFLKATSGHNAKILTMEKGEKGNKLEDKNLLECMKDAPLMSLHEGVACMVHGIATSIPITLSLIFTWATTSVYMSLGVDRVILSWILSDKLSLEILPVVVFLNAFLLSMITGSSWSCVSILIPGTMPHLVQSLDGESKFMVIILASLLSGAAAGDHIGPFSETTILSAIISGSEVRRHFLTQAPCAIFVFVLSALVGTLPISYGRYSSSIGHGVGVGVLILFILFVCRKVERYQSGIPGQIQDEPTQTWHSVITKKSSSISKGRSTMSSKRGVNAEQGYLEPNLEQVSILQCSKQQDTEVVEKSGRTSIQKQNKSKAIREIGDSIMGLVEDGCLSEDEGASSRNEYKKSLIEDTIKKTDEEGNAFSDSLRLFLRSAEQKLGNILEKKENIEIARSASQDSAGDDSLDNLMMNIAAAGWRKGITNILREDPETSTNGGGEYTTDGGSMLIESDDSSTGTSSSFGDNGESTCFTGYDQSTYFNGEATSCASSTTGLSEFTNSSSRLREINYNISRIQTQEKVDDVFTAADFTQGSF